MEPRVFIADLDRHFDEVVRISGFVHVLRDQKKMQFLILMDGTGLAQAVHEKNSSEADTIRQSISAVTPGSAVSIVGKVRRAPAVKLGGLEVAIKTMEVESLAQIPLPVARDSAIEKQLDHRHISLRSPETRLTFAVQTTLEHAMREFWKKQGFIEIHSPKLMGTFSESGAEVFKVEYFNRTAYLAQSPQFYKQMAIAGGFERVFEIGSVFRAEPSFTSRHETEFTSIDVEIAWIESHEDVMRLEEELLVHALGAVEAEHGSAIERLLGLTLRVPTIPFPRLSLEEARSILRQHGHSITHTADLDPEGERRICTYVEERYDHEFVFIHDYPAAIRAFYHMRDPHRPSIAKGFDLLWKGVEITTGAQREHRYEQLMAQALERGLALEPIQGYLDFFKYGCPPHGGAGIGLGRLLMALLGKSSLREVALLSRTPTRLTP